MTNKTFRRLLKAIAAFVITAAFGSASFAGDFTVREGKRYCAILALNSVERLADNALIARKFRALGFSKVRVQVPERCVASRAFGPARMPARSCRVRLLRLQDCNAA